MKKQTIEAVQQLHTMTVGELKRKYAEVFGETTRSYNKDYLRKKIAWRLQELDEGGLSDRARRRADELANDADLRVHSPRSKPDQQTVQTAASNSINSKSGLKEIPPGTTLRRVYKGRTLLVTATDHGFLFEGETYRSLTAIAKEVTGSMWNGRLFFGITKPSRKKDEAERE